MPSDANVHILVIGDDRTMAGRWVERLKTAGFTSVRRTETNKVQANDAADVLIFLPQPQESRNRIARALLREHPQRKIVMLYDGAISGTEIAHAVIHSDCDLEDFVRMIRYLAQRLAEGTSSA